MFALKLWYAFLGIFIVRVHAVLVDQILAALGNATDCASCHASVLPPIRTLAALGDSAFVSTFIQVCEVTGAEDNDVCEGELQRSGPILAHDLRNFEVGGVTATKFCEALFGLLTPFTVEFPKPAPLMPPAFVSKGRTPFKVVHMSDVHIDRQYTVGADANCTKNICCRNFADHVGSINEPAGPFGNGRCDSPSDLAQSLLGAVQEIGHDAAFAIFTGDVVEGVIHLSRLSTVYIDLQEWNSQMAASVGLTVYPAIGHDTAPVNSFPRNTTNPLIGDSQFVFDTQSSGWKRWIGEEAAQQVHHMSGSYSKIVPGMNLRILSMNTQYWYKQNFWVYDKNEQTPDPNGLLAFMVSQLQLAEDAGQRVWIIGHIPSGKADFMHDQSNYYDQIVQRYKYIIAAQFFGHSHKDQFEIAYSDWSNQSAETADSILFIGPALTPTSGNPAFKLYDVDPDTFEVLDMKVYFTNVSSPSFQEKPIWELYYSARDSYAPLVNINLSPTDPLNASFWHKLTDVFEANETAFQLWNTRLSRGGAVTPCTDECVRVSICDMRAARSENNCDVDTPNANFGFKRGLPEHVASELELCEGTMIRRMFTRMLGKNRRI
ncbi:acid sphingomyelinase [Vararia minispora EC-137]|uniref:Acid sphingomyelinase n=1 Tax=Vararia minispora EC-137 TaxID=1314806 RepID=A0ACB8QHG9_9AGAM|nr:acid sphingomyelinase [Vararia minispora EC-137]